jgi:hypothetical protein
MGRYVGGGKVDFKFLKVDIQCIIRGGLLFALQVYNRGTTSLHIGVGPKRNDSYTHFSQHPHNKPMWLVIFSYFFTKRKQKKTKK